MGDNAGFRPGADMVLWHYGMDDGCGWIHCTREDSATFEKAYLKDPNMLFKHKARGFIYTINLKLMFQLNVTTGSSRKLRRYGKSVVCPPAAEVLTPHTEVDERQAPNSMLCIITAELMVHPVSSPSGYSYEKDALKSWLDRTPTDPITREHITWDQVHTNRALKDLIDCWKAREGESDR